MSEMAFARSLIKGNRVERARLYKASNEACFGVQIATNAIHEGVAAAKLAAEAGASWIDLNCGCPIYEATKRGCGAALLRKPAKLARLVAGIAADSPLPLTVKIRTGESEKKINAALVVGMMGGAGAAAVTVHGRTTEQRYKKAADWQLIGQLSSDYDVPIIGNGDLLTHYEMTDRQQQHACLAMMVGRGALIKPWIFQEVKEGRELLLTAVERIGVYRQLVCHMKDHFRDDAIGKKRAFYFLPWHFAFFHRYRHLPSSVYHEASRQHPLIATRFDLVDEKLGETLEVLPLLERLLRCESEAAHGVIADTLWEAGSDVDAVTQLEKVAAEQLMDWEEEVRDLHSRGGRSGDEAAVEG